MHRRPRWGRSGHQRRPLRALRALRQRRRRVGRSLPPPSSLPQPLPRRSKDLCSTKNQECLIIFLWPLLTNLEDFFPVSRLARTSRDGDSVPSHGVREEREKIFCALRKFFLEVRPPVLYFRFGCSKPGHGPDLLRLRHRACWQSDPGQPAKEQRGVLWNPCRPEACLRNPLLT